MTQQAPIFVAEKGSARASRARLFFFQEKKGTISLYAIFAPVFFLNYFDYILWLGILDVGPLDVVPSKPPDMSQNATYSDIYLAVICRMRHIQRYLGIVSLVFMLFLGIRGVQGLGFRVQGLGSGFKVY
jgi:hypothetical protein